jgi:ribosomal protein L34E
VFLLSCSPKYSLRGIRYNTIEVPGQDQAINIAKRHAEETARDTLEMTLPGIRWVEPVQGDKECVGIKYQGRCYGGITFGCSEIYVVRYSYISTSSLVHELFHCYYFHLYGDVDPIHLDEDWWYSAEMANNEVRVRGL